MIAQRRAFVLPAEQAAFLQQRHHFAVEFLQPAGEEGRHDVEAVGGAVFEPFLHAVGHVFCRAHDDVVAATCGNAQRKFTDCQLFAARQLGQKFGAAAQLVGDRQVRQGAVEIVFGKAVADALFQQRHGAFDVGPAVQFLQLFAGLFEAPADDRHETRHYRDAGRIAAKLRDPRLEAGVEGLRFGNSLLGGEDDIGGAGGEVLSRAGGAGLNENRVPLRRARNIERSLDREIFAFVVENMHLFRIDVTTCLLVLDESIVVPAVPQTAHHIHIFFRHRITLVMLGVVLGKVCRRAGIGGGDDVPRRAAVAQVIDGSEGAGGVVRLAIGGGGGGGETDLVGHHRKRCQQCQRLETGDHRGVGVDAAGEAIGEEDHVELRRFGHFRDAGEQVEIFAAGLGIGVTPAGNVVSGALQEKAEMHLSFAGRGGHGDHAFMSVELYLCCQKRIELPEVGCGFHGPHQCRNSGEFFTATGGVGKFFRRVIDARKAVDTAR